MTHFGLIKLESSNLLDITIIDGYIVLHITNLQNMAYIVGCKIVIKSCRSKKFWDLLVIYIYKIHRILTRHTAQQAIFLKYGSPQAKIREN